MTQKNLASRKAETVSAVTPSEKTMRAENKRKAKAQGETLRKLAVIERSQCLIDVLERQIPGGGMLR